MIIKSIKRPWEKKSYQKKTVDRYYQSQEWRNKVDYIWIRDKGLCQLCLKDGIIHQLKRGTNDINQQGTVDHKKQRKEGGNDHYENLWLIGSNHHYSKSANEGNNTQKYLKY